MPLLKARYASNLLWVFAAFILVIGFALITFIFCKYTVWLGECCIHRHPHFLEVGLQNNDQEAVKKASWRPLQRKITLSKRRLHLIRSKSRNFGESTKHLFVFGLECYSLIFVPKHALRRICEYACWDLEGICKLAAYCLCKDWSWGNPAWRGQRSPHENSEPESIRTSLLNAWQKWLQIDGNRKRGKSVAASMWMHDDAWWCMMMHVSGFWRAPLISQASKAQELMASSRNLPDCSQSSQPALEILEGESLKVMALSKVHRIAVGKVTFRKVIAMIPSPIFYMSLRRCRIG